MAWTYEPEIGMWRDWEGGSTVNGEVWSTYNPDTTDSKTWTQISGRDGWWQARDTGQYWIGSGDPNALGIDPKSVGLVPTDRYGEYYDAIHGAGALESEAQRYAQLEASNQLGGAEDLYGEFPDDWASQIAWFERAAEHGSATAIEQDRIAQNSRTELTEAAIMAAVSAWTGAAIGAAGAAGGAGALGEGGAGVMGLGTNELASGLAASELPSGALAGPAYGGGGLGDASSFYNDMGATTLEGGTSPSFDLGSGGTGMDFTLDPNATYWTDVGGATSGGSALFPGLTEFLKANPWAMPLASTLAGGVLGGVSGSQSPAGTTTTTQSSIPPELAPYLQNLFGSGGAAGLLPGGVAMTGGTGGGGVLSGAALQLNDTIAGNYFPQAQWNPYGGMFTPGASNPYIGQTAQVGTNPYFGMNNQYLQPMIDRASDDVQSRVMGQFNKSAGAFGGSANQEILARELAAMQNQFRYQDYGLQAQLGEAAANRTTSTSLADLARNSSLAQNMSQFNSNLYSGDLTRNANIYGTDAQRNLNQWNAERGRQFSGATAAPEWQTSQTQANFAPYTAYANLLKGWGSSTSTPYFQNPTGGALGGALAGYSLSKMFG